MLKVTEAVLLLARSLVQKGWYSPEDHVVSNESLDFLHLN